MIAATQMRRGRPPVTEKFERFEIRLPKVMLEALKEEAARTGVGASTWARGWLLRALASSRRGG